VRRKGAPPHRSRYNFVEHAYRRVPPASHNVPSRGPRVRGHPHLRGPVIQPAHYFDLEGRALNFKPERRGYSVSTAPAKPVAGMPGELLGKADYQFIRSWGYRKALPFSFPFSGKIWREVFINGAGNLTFGRPEAENYPERDTWPDATMQSVGGSINNRAAAGQELMICALSRTTRAGTFQLSEERVPHRSRTGNRPTPRRRACWTPGSWPSPTGQPQRPRLAPTGSPGSRAWSFHACQGPQTARSPRVLAIAHPWVLPSAMRNNVGTPVAIISQINTLPACAPVNASMATLRLAMHASGSGWFAKTGSAREFGETANWRRLERSSLPGISEVRIQALSGRSEASNLLSGAVFEDLESWNRRIVRERWWSQPLILRSLRGGFAFQDRLVSAFSSPSDWRVELAPR
jgi:hypothetical protein